MPEDRLARARVTLPKGYQFPSRDHDHDYRACQQPDGSYRAVCRLCLHDEGPIDLRGWQVWHGVRILNP